MTTLSLGSINLTDGTWSIGMSSVDTSSVAAAVTVAEGKATSHHLGNYGSLKLDSEGVLTLQGGSDLKGDIAISGDGASVLSAVSFGAAVSVSLGGEFTSLTNVKMGGGADAVTLNITNKDFNLNTGAGNDTVIIETVDASSKIDLGAGNDLVSVTGLAGEVVLGAGKDTLELDSTNGATVTASDYNFNDDVIVLDNATLDATGKLVANKVEVNGLTATNGVYFAKVNGAGTATTILATAEEDAGKVVITDTVSKKENVIIIDAESADSANITLGKASLASVALKAGNDAVDTIKIGDTKATVNAVVTGFSTDDVLNFTGLTFDKITIGESNSSVTLGSGHISLTLGNVSLSDGGAQFNLNGTKLYAATTDDQILNLTEESDLSKVLIKGGNDETKAQTIQTSAKWVDLSASNIYNINAVKLTADTAAKASVIGTKNDKAGITIDASEATDGVAVWANNSSTKKGDLISLSASTDVADTLWFGSADGKDSVANFSLASDVLYLYDATNMTAKNGVLKVGNAEMSVRASASDEEIMQVQGAKFAGTVYAAGEFTTDDVVVLGENAGKVNYYAVGKDEKVSLTSAMTDSYTFLNSIDYAGATKANIAAGGSVASIDASATTSDSKIIIEGVANVSLGAGTNEYWANGAKNAVVELTNDGVDKIWFSASDKKVTVGDATQTFSTESDVIALMGSIGEFTAKADGSNAVISNANKGALTITGVTSDINLVDANGAKYKLYVANADYTTNTDGTNIYLGAQLNASSEVTAATNIVVEGANNKWGIASSAIVGESVKTIDMSASSADFVLVGSANAANTITGGTGTNYLNGGGASKDVLNGVTGAVDNFYYGKEDGNDTIVNIGAEDIVQLYDVATADLVNVNVKDDKTVITLNNDRKLTINNSIADGATFVLTDGTYVFDSSVEGNWVKK